MDMIPLQKLEVDLPFFSVLGGFFLFFRLVDVFVSVLGPVDSLVRLDFFRVTLFIMFLIYSVSDSE